VTVARGNWCPYREATPKCTLLQVLRSHDGTRLKPSAAQQLRPLCGGIAAVVTSGCSRGKMTHSGVRQEAGKG
jgi:hypothetical protein